MNRPGRNSKQPTEVNQIIRKTVDLVCTYLKKSKIQVELELSTEIPSIIDSLKQLGHVFLNLINNAAEAISGFPEPDTVNQSKTGMRNKIFIETRLGEDNIVINVTNTGPGILEEDLTHIFDPFFTNKKKKGMGIGLSICHGIAEDHNGRIEAMNVKDGRAKFNFFAAELVELSVLHKPQPS